MSHCVADGILVPRPGKIRLNLYLLHWEHIVWLTTGSPGKSLLLFFSFWGFLPCLSDFQSVPWSNFDPTWAINSLIRLWHYLNVTSTNYNRVKENFTFRILSFAIQHWISPTQDQILSLEQVECWRREAEREYWWLDHCDGSVHPSTVEFISWSLQSHLFISAPPPSLKPGEEYFSPGKQRKPCIHSSSVVLTGTVFPEDILATMPGHSFFVTTEGGGDCCTQWVEVRDAATHPAMHRSPHQQRLVWSKCQPC